MYQGTNPSALRSREWLCNALVELLKIRKYEQITIKEICQKADLSRQTFYKIYNSKDEVVEYKFSCLFSEFKDACDSLPVSSLNELTLCFFSFFKAHSDFIYIMIENNMNYLLEREFERFLPKVDLFQSINCTEQYPDYSLCFVAGALCQVLIHWFENELDLPVETIAGLTRQILTGDVFKRGDQDDGQAG